MTYDEARLLSRLLFEARELADMYGDMVEQQCQRPDQWTRRLVTEIDEYRASRGWPAGGFGDETADQTAGHACPAPPA